MLSLVPTEIQSQGTLPGRELTAESVKKDVSPIMERYGALLLDGYSRIEQGLKLKPEECEPEVCRMRLDGDTRPVGVSEDQFWISWKKLKPYIAGELYKAVFGKKSEKGTLVISKPAERHPKSVDGMKIELDGPDGPISFVYSMGPKVPRAERVDQVSFPPRQ